MDQYNIKLMELKYKQIMAFNYKSGLKLFLSQIKNMDKFDIKDVFFSIVALDRENLNIVLKLSNKADDDIDYNEIFESNPILQGSYSFTQTRLHLEIKWKLFLT